MIMRKVILLLFSFIWLPFHGLQGENTLDFFTDIKHFERQYELSNRSIKCIVQDSTGFLWIGTSNGLNKFDGNNITHYYADPYDSTSISDNYIQNLYIDSDGILWVLTPDYFCRYNEEKDNFTQFRFTEDTKNTQTSNPGGIVEDSQGNIWLGTPEQGLHSFNKRTGEFQFHPLPGQTIACLAIDKDENLWIGSLGKIFIYNIKSNTYSVVNVPRNETLVKIAPGQQYALTRDRLYYISYQGSTVILHAAPESPPYKKAEILSVLSTPDYLWYGSRGEGIFIYDKKKRKFYSAQYDSNSRNSLSDNTVRILYKDRYGVVWIGTDDGLNKYIPHVNPFLLYSYDENRNSVISNLITGFTEDIYHRVWISTYGGVSRFDPQTKIFTNFKEFTLSDGKRISCKNMRDITTDSKGNIWFLPKWGILKLDEETKQYSSYRLLFNHSEASDLLCIYAENDNIWVGSYGDGLFQIDNTTGTIITAFNTGNSQISSNYIKNVIRLDDGTLCLATLRTGIDIYNPLTHQFRNIHFSDLTHNYMSDFVNDVFQDSKKNIWVLSWHGAFVLNKNWDIVYQFTTDNGLLSNELNTIFEDNNGNIWLGSTNGLSRLQGYTGNNIHISNYTTEDGIASNLISTNSFFVSSDKETVYVGTANGINVFRPKDVPVNNRAIAPIITSLRVFNKEIKPNMEINGQVILQRPIYQQSSIQLNHKQKSISIHFVSLDFSQSKNFKYAYKLDGLDKDWLYTGDNNSANYNNLPPGDYTFRVKAKNMSGIWSQETLLYISVQPPWWNTWWAYVLYAISAISISLIISRIFVYQEKLKQNLRIEKIQHDKENELNDIRLRFYTNISHDIRTPLTLIVGPLSSILKYEDLSTDVKGQLKLVNKNASYLLSLINQLLDFRTMEVGERKLMVSQHNIVQFVQEITQAFDLYARQKNIELTFTSREGEENIYFDPQLMSKVFYNLISNAIKFTNENGKISVTITASTDEVFVSVSDTGIGISAEEQKKIFEDFYQIQQHNATALSDTYTSGSGIGLSIVKKYVEIHHGKVCVESKLGIGSSFTVVLKKGIDHFSECQIDKDYSPESSRAISSNQEDTKSTCSDNHTAANNEHLRNSVLVVDDNSDIVQYMSRCLQTDFIVYTASNGKQGLEIAEKELPDIIISDIIMPEMDGFELAKALKGNELTAHIPLLFLTAKSSVEDTVKGVEVGAVEYITKPFHEAILLAKVKNLVKDRNLLQKNLKEQYQKFLQADLQIDEEKSSVENISDAFMIKVVQYVESNVVNSELNAENVASHFNISKVQLYRKLKAVSDLSITDIIYEIRIKKAEELLLKSSLNISEIAYSLNFSDPFHFSKMFKKKTGVSPMQYRKSHLTR